MTYPILPKNLTSRDVISCSTLNELFKKQDNVNQLFSIYFNNMKNETVCSWCKGRRYEFIVNDTIKITCSYCEGTGLNIPCNKLTMIDEKNNIPPYKLLTFEAVTHQTRPASWKIYSNGSNSRCFLCKECIPIKEKNLQLRRDILHVRQIRFYLDINSQLGTKDYKDTILYK